MDRQIKGGRQEGGKVGTQGEGERRGGEEATGGWPKSIQDEGTKPSAGFIVEYGMCLRD
jgi:hypothetical protein